MHYYQFNIGDYASHTRHLSLIEDLAYRRLLDLYYLHERPLNDCSTHLARLIGLSDYPQEVETVLIEFFEHKDGGYINGRADKEIAHYHSKIEQASKAGKASAERRFNARSTDVQPNIKQEPITNNHKPIKAKATSVACPESVNQQVWDDWMTVRKEKKAKTLTETGWKQFVKQVEKAGWGLEQAISHCCLKQWVGFEADWVAQKVSHQDIARITTPTPANHDAALRKIEEDRKKAAKPSAEVQAKIAELLRGRV
jgi:uncharacterized protein YdaU (DUF1376 family)